jgi:hypothetical protein
LILDREGAPVKYAELQIGLQLWGASEFEVEVVYSDSSGPGEQRLTGDAPRLAAFDREQLLALTPHPRDYGRALGRALFAAPEVAAFFAQSAQAAAALVDPKSPDDKPGCPLQVRLYLGRRVSALHDLRWETLCDPRDGEFLATKETIVFSRYLSSPYYRPLRSRDPGDRLKVVAVVADPANATELTVGSRRRRLTRIDAPGELGRLRPALDPTHYEQSELAGPGAATLDGIVERAGAGCDILYLVCHGELIEGDPWLWLVDTDNRAARTSGVVLVTRLMELLHQPQLVVLASCQSGGVGRGELQTDDNGALAALGPRLAEAGIPAVLAMQGNVTASTVGAFMPTFFRSLATDSAVDVAVASARRQQSVRDRDDFWAPVLFTRLQSGRIWSPQGLETGGRTNFRAWDGFLANLENGQATALLGLGLLEPLLGSREEVAEQWAQRYEYPLASYRREDLTQVAQYLAVQQGILFPGTELTRQMKRELLCRFDAERRRALEGAALNQILREARPLYREAAGIDPHEVLAGLPFRAYLSASGDDLMTDALSASTVEIERDGRRESVPRDPQVRYFNWQATSEAGEDEPVVLEKPPPGRPFARSGGTVGRPPANRPLVYHLFGHFDYPDTLTLTEDNYIDHLISLTQNRGQIPKAVTSALVDSALLFLGFRFDDWSFRVLFRSIIRLQGSERLGQYTNVAVQIDPERDRIADPQMARRYLEDYFGKTGAKINVYWGSVPRFVRELRDRWQTRQQGR